MAGKATLQGKESGGQESKIDPLASRFSMRELDSHTSQIVLLAHRRPIIIDRYKRPFVCLVPYEAWVENVKTENYVPSRHPLVAIDMALQSELGNQRQVSEPNGNSRRPRIAHHVLLRVLMLQALYSLPAIKVVRECILANMVFRWFVGLSMTQSVWDSESLARETQAFLEDETMVYSLCRAMLCATSIASDMRTDMHVNYGLVDAWRARHGRHWGACDDQFG